MDTDVLPFRICSLALSGRSAQAAPLSSDIYLAIQSVGPTDRWTEEHVAVRDYDVRIAALTHSDPRSRVQNLLSVGGA